MREMLKLASAVDLVLKLAQKAPDYTHGKIFVSPQTAQQLGIVDCLSCSDSGLIIKGSEVKGCPDCNV